MSLNQVQFAELSDLLVENFDDEGRELDRVVIRYLGSPLFVDYAAHDKFRNVVDQLLTKTEQKGSTFNLFRGVLKVRGNNTHVKAIIERNLPEVILEVPDIAKRVSAVAKGVQAVYKCLEIRQVHALVSALRPDLERLTSDLEILDRYKALHDCLHTLQIQFLRLILIAARGLGIDPSAGEALIAYLAQLQVQAAVAQAASQGLPDTSERDLQMEWVHTLATSIDILKTAVIKLDQNAAIECVYGLNSMLRVQPSILGKRIGSIARRTPFASLVKTLEGVVAASAGEDEQGRDLANGIDALQRLIPDQMGLVAEHSEWQKIADALWNAEELLHQSSADAFAEFQFVWQKLAATTREIAASDPASNWAFVLTKHAVDFEQLIPRPPVMTVSGQAKMHFGMFMNSANLRFFEVDKALRAQCSEIVTLRQPLQSLLKDIDDDRYRHGGE